MKNQLIADNWHIQSIRLFASTFSLSAHHVTRNHHTIHAAWHGLHYYPLILLTWHEIKSRTIQFSKEGELLNGQHRLRGVVKCGSPVKMFFVYNVDKDAFATYDLQRTRTAADLFNLEGIRNANNKAALITKYIVLTKQEGDSKSSLKKKKITKYEILMEYINHRDLYDAIYEKTEKCYFKRNYLTTSEYGAYMTYLIKERKHDEKTVYSFFMQLAEVEPCRTDVINLLRDKLYKDRTSLRLMVHAEKYAYVVKAWNAYITGKEVKVLYFDPVKEKAAPAFQ